MIYERKITEDGYSIVSAKYSTQGKWITVEGGGLESWDSNPNQEYLVVYDVLDAPEKDDERFKIAYGNIGESLKISELGFDSRKAAETTSRFLKCLFERAMVVDRNTKKKRMTREDDPEMWDRDFYEDNNIVRGQHPEVGSY